MSAVEQEYDQEGRGNGEQDDSRQQFTVFTQEEEDQADDGQNVRGDEGPPMATVSQIDYQERRADSQQDQGHKYAV